MRYLPLLWLSAILTFVHLGAPRAGPLAEAQVPDPLKPWIDWVLYDKDERPCAPLYNTTHRQCAWPSRLELSLNEEGGSFDQTWQAYRASWAPLPGDGDRWPGQVLVDGQEAVVVARDGGPAVRLTPGTHQVEGAWVWERLPDTLAIPPDTGIIDLTLNGSRVVLPNRKDPGRLWLVQRGGAAAKGAAASDTLELQVFRRVIDDQPMQVLTRIQLSVSGRQRELVLGSPLLEGSIPVSLSGGLPARLESDGRLRVQLRPGTWVLELRARYPEYVEQLSWKGGESPWPKSEIWVLDARTAIRLVEVEGVAALDPRQTRLPADWGQLPAYRIEAGQIMRFKVLRRGDPEPEPSRLSLQRNLWLDFDGGGYTLQDRITGAMTSGWRLQTVPELALGSAVLDGHPQLITRLEGSARPGVEVRRGLIDLVADLRYQGDIASVPAGGWDQDFYQTVATLHLPPGWKLFSASGIDNVPRTWLQRWTLLDLFLVLVTAVAVARLWGWQWGLLALAALALIWHEADAPRYVWLNIVAAVALLRVVPPGRFRSVVTWYRNLSLLALAAISIPFLVNQVRIGLYPQLERPWLVPGDQQSLMPGTGLAPQVVGGIAGSVVDAVRPRAMEAEEAPAPKAAAPSSKSTAYDERQLELDPDARLQTGPGLPRWQWTSVPLGWNGPVQEGQRIGLVLLPPWANLLLNLLRVLLLLALAWRLLGIRGFKLRAGVLPAVALLACAPLLLAFPDDVRADYPPPELLEQLESRLLAPPECLPSCADIQSMSLELRPGLLLLDLRVQAAEPTAVPLPGNRALWQPSRVRGADGADLPLFSDAEGNLWVRVPQGGSRLILGGELSTDGSLQLELALMPHHVSVRAEGWQVEGLDENAVPQGPLQLTRVAQAAEPERTEALSPGVLPPFLRVERVLKLGLDWVVETRVSRLSPTGSPLVVRVPLLRGERVLTPGMQQRDDRVLVSMAPQQAVVIWDSALVISPLLELKAVDSPELTEVWRADIGPVWHAEFSGIAPVHYQDSRKQWLPEWRPWPGEELAISVSRPQGVEGQSLTVDASRLQVAPAKRATEATLELALRSSQGGQHDILLPEDAALQSVTLGGQAQPIRQEQRRVTLPLVPGSQTFVLHWRQPTGIEPLFSTPGVDLGLASVNSRIQVLLGEDRWVLWTAGPRLGPAVLFWGVLVVISLVAVGLGRVRMTPLRARHWLLLGIGLSQAPVWVGIIVVGWLLALGWRGRDGWEAPGGSFNVIQVGLALLTLAALVQLFDAVRLGLLGAPEMQIAGNGSSAQQLNWYQDRIGAALPRARVVSVPLLVYRLLMLGWALWLAFALVGWLRWGWGCFSHQGFWRKIDLEIPHRRRGRARSSSADAAGREQAREV